MSDVWNIINGETYLTIQALLKMVETKTIEQKIAEKIAQRQWGMSIEQVNTKLKENSSCGKEKV